MKILVTGAFGNIGVSTLKALAGRGHALRCFDVDTPANRQSAAQFGDGVEIRWGDITRQDDVAKAVAGMDVVLHLAAIIPPLSEKIPDKARAVNVDGTRHIVEALEQARAAGAAPRLVFCSSSSVLGKNRDLSRLASADEPLVPSDHYSQHKVSCEQMLRASGIQWCILRFNAVPPVRVDQFDPIMFEISLDGQVEFVHTLDVGFALANAAESEAVWGKVLMIGGGPRCRMHYREFFTGVLDTAGVGMLPEAAFGRGRWYSDWMDTAESQALLKYQRHVFDDYLKELDALLSWRKPLVRLFRPLIRYFLTRQSPYYGRAG